MCQSGREMYEGKNIHYSPVDNKPLCSFSRKLCNQRRLNGYAFCVRHILEDPTAPFRRCAYVAKSSQQMCTQAIPQGEQRQYCNNHMQVLGMLPRRERKPKKEKDKDKDKDKEKDKDKDVSLIKDSAASSDINRMTFGDRLKSKKLTIPKGSATSILGKVANPVEDPDDPYAFHDAAPDIDVQAMTNSATQASAGGGGSSGVSVNTSAEMPHPQPLPSPVQSRPAGEGNQSKAKLYPELAEKLEKVRPSPETKTAKSRARSSRTMNKLQTKIAQNKIKDKLRKSQESNQAEMSPSQMVASPERAGLTSAGLLISGVPGSDFGVLPSSAGVTSPGMSPAQLHPVALPGVGLPPFDSGRTGTGVGQMGMERLNHRTLTSQLLSPLHSQPPPYPGLPPHREGSFPLTSESHRGQTVAAAGSLPPVTTALPSDIAPHPIFSSPQASVLSPAVTVAQSQHPHLHSPHPRHQLPRQSSLPGSSVPSTADSADGLYLPHASVMNQNLHRTPSGNVSAFPQTSAILASKAGSVPHAPAVLSPPVAAVGSDLDLPPPPPYVPRPSVTSSVSTSLPNSGSVLFTRLQRLRGLLSEKDARKRLKSDLAVKVYAMHAHRKINNHVFMGSSMSLCVSDEEESCDEDGSGDALPWQSDWRVISDDEEETSELDADGELPADLRTAKLGLLRARLRRQCTQTKHATRSNTTSLRSSNKFTMALIKLAKENSFSAAQTLSTILHKPLRWPDERPKKQKNLWKKTCLYKDAADKQCTSMCLPYANHCRKHVMYNVDQQLFEFCTAKNTDNTQCCMPVIDLCHDIPLCFPHAAQAELAKMEEVVEVKKRPRKKTKPPALTRPPRKGKKKKGKNARPQKPMPPDKPIGDTSMPETIPMDIAPSESPAAAAETTQPAQPPTPPAAVSVASSSSRPSGGETVSRPAKTARSLELASVDLEDTLTSELDKQFELPLEQASRLLEEQDFQEVFNKIPDDAFTDIFSMADKNGEREEVLEEETKQLEQALKSANITLQGLIKGTVKMEDLNEEATVQVAEMLADMQGLTVESVQQSDLTAAALDLFSGPSGSQGLSSLALPVQPAPPASAAVLQPQQQVSLADFSHLVSAASSSRGAPQQAVSMASYLPAVVSTTTINGISLPLPQSLVPQSPSSFGQQQVLAALPASYASSSATQQAATPVVTQMYTDGRVPHGYQVVTAAAGQVIAGAQPCSMVQGQDQVVGGQSQTSHTLPALTGFTTGLQGLQGLPQALLLGTADLAQSQQALLAARGIASSQIQQGRASGHPSPTIPPTCLSAQVLARSVTLDTSAAGVHPQQSRTGVSVSAAPLHGQPQAVLDSQLAGPASHPSWIIPTTLQQQQQQAGVTYHTVNGFPTTPQLPYVHPPPPVTASQGLPATSVSSLPKFSSLVAQASSGSGAAQQVTQTLVTGAPGLTTLTGLKQDLSLPVGTAHPSTSIAAAQLSGSASAGTASIQGVMSGLKTDPRLASLTHSLAAGRSGSPGGQGFVPAHSPSPTPQPVNQTVPPFSAALPLYQSSSSGS